MSKRWILIFILGAIMGASVSGIGFALTGQGSFPVSKSDEFKGILEAKDRLTDELLVIDGVSGVGVGECEKTLCILVYLEEEDSALIQQVPSEFEGFLVDIKISGKVEALSQ